MFSNYISHERNRDLLCHLYQPWNNSLKTSAYTGTALSITCIKAVPTCTNKAPFSGWQRVTK